MDTTWDTFLCAGCKRECYAPCYLGGVCEDCAMVRNPLVCRSCRGIGWRWKLSFDKIGRNIRTIGHCAVCEGSGTLTAEAV